MNIQEKYKLIKEKYKEIKEQNDIFKKAILEYKKDIKQLEKNNEEQKDRIKLMLDENNDLLSNNSQLSNKIAHLTSSLEEQKKSNSGWRNLMLLTKNSRENIQESVAFEELENKIKENETLHKKIDDLQIYNEKMEKELELFKSSHKEKLNVKKRHVTASPTPNFPQDHEKTIENLNDIINNSNRNMIKIEQEKDEIKQQMETYKANFTEMIETNKANFAEIVEKKNEHITKIEQVLKILKRKCYHKYKINFNRIPLFEKPDHCDGYLQNKINEHCKLFQNYVLNVIQNFQDYLVVCKNIFAFQEIQLNDNYQKFDGNQRDDNFEYSKIIDLKGISKKEVIFLEEAINLLDHFKKYWIGSQDKQCVLVVLRNLSDTVRRIFLNVNVYLCIEEYLFPTYTNVKIYALKNTIRELRNLKRVILKIINLFRYVLLITPYDNNKIVEEYFKNRNITNKFNEIEGKQNFHNNLVYSNEANYDEIGTDVVSSEEEIDISTDKIPQFSGANFKRLLEEKEKKYFSKYEDLKNCTEKNKKIIVYLVKKFKTTLEDLCYSFKFLKSYISFRICEMKGSDHLQIDNSKVMTEMLDITISFINSLENLDIVKVQFPLISVFSYSRFNTRMFYEEEKKCIKKINADFNETKHIPYSTLENSFRNLEIYKNDNDLLNKEILRKTKIIKKLKKINHQTLSEFKSLVIKNKELTLKKQFFENCLTEKRENSTQMEEDTTDQGIQKYAEMVFNFVASNNPENKGLNVHEKQLIEAYICSCIKIKHLNMEIKKNVEALERLENEFSTKEGEVQKLNLQIETYKEEETNIHKKYEEQMNTLHDLIVTLEKQISKMNSEKNVHKFFILCSICGNKNNMGNILKSRKCLSCNSIIIFLK
ncbi:hypothetical protein, conserved [Plasmodium gonderi]|uniref:Protein phosphatase 1 regulatory subunit 21 N-terminal domain-containing protein n=1 Tax=Plasmodium gonderi TaxID=77519 RepID=A0A1Y1J9S8_PLAGO|nr:hypothetical protein, conserved [Plasmodium gonderi]GAW79246.1 hypothetical protein, conserved [Plasmodium gonderi]